MTSVKSEIKINAPKEKVWNIIADLGGIVKFHPFITKSHYTSEQKEEVGSSRYCYMLPSTELNEKVIDWQPGESYKVMVQLSGEQIPPVKDMHATMAVNEDSEGVHASIISEYRFAGDTPMEKEVEGQLQMMLDGVMMGLKHYAETGEEVDMNLFKQLQTA
jgi:hypothetical protein